MSPVRRSLSVLLPLIVLLATCAGAQAANRYASEGGSGTACTESTPCSLVEAIGPNSDFGNDVTVEPGTYGSSSVPLSLLTAYWNEQVIHGRAGAPAPVVYVTTPDPLPSVPYTPPGYGFNTNKGSLTHLDIRVIGTATTFFGVSVVGSSMDHVRVTGNARWGACTGHVNMTNVLCQSSWPAAAGIGLFVAGSGPLTFNYTYRNVTAISSGVGGTGLDVSINDFIVENLTVVNSIFDGAGADIRTESNGNGGAALNLSASNSNYPVLSAGANTTVTPNTTNGNQATPATFADAASLDFRPAPGSPTVDGGMDDPANGTTDLAGSARIQGLRTDIGAYESSFLGASPPEPKVPTVLTGLKALTKKFASAKSGNAFRPASKRPRTRKGEKPVGTLINFTLNQPDTVNFTLERGTSGRKSGSKCVKKTRGNAAKKKCTRYVAVKGTESVVGVVGKNTVWFTGRWKEKTLPAGSSFVMRGTPIKASTGNEPGVLSPRPIKTFPK
ncbi:MAG: choice-of-anchor Q domain-containing protein [Solirubrobacterales bacterium]